MVGRGEGTLTPRGMGWDGGEGRHGWAGGRGPDPPPHGS